MNSVAECQRFGSGILLIAWVLANSLPPPWHAHTPQLTSAPQLNSITGAIYQHTTISSEAQPPINRYKQDPKPWKQLNCITQSQEHALLDIRHLCRMTLIMMANQQLGYWKYSSLHLQATGMRRIHVNAIFGRERYIVWLLWEKCSMFKTFPQNKTTMKR